MLNLTDKYNELTKPNLKELSKTLLLATESLIEVVAKEGKQNEQWFLDYLDELNRLSVIY